MFGNEVVPPSLTGSRAASLHKRSGKAVAKNLRNYKEKKAPALKNGMGGMYVDENKKFVSDARMSEYTASANKFGLGGPVHGFRATLAGGELVATVVCQCSERDWPKLKPAFLRVIASVRERKQPDPDEGMTLPGTGMGVPPLGGG